MFRHVENFHVLARTRRAIRQDDSIPLDFDCYDALRGIIVDTDFGDSLRKGPHDRPAEQAPVAGMLTKEFVSHVERVCVVHLGRACLREVRPQMKHIGLG